MTGFVWIENPPLNKALTINKIISFTVEGEPAGFFLFVRENS